MNQATTTTTRRYLITATLRADVAPEVRAWWHEVFGGDSAPLLSPRVDSATIEPLGDGPRDVYFLAVAALPPAIQERLIDHLARRFHLPRDGCARDVRNVGVPILAEHVTVTVDMRALL